MFTRARPRAVLSFPSYPPPAVALYDQLVATGKRFYCICFGPRSGSTLLCGDLAQWDVGAPTEIFQSTLYPESNKTIAHYVMRAVDRSPGRDFGFKISWEQAHTLCSRLRGEESGDSADVFDLRLIFPELRFVHVIRNDKVAQAVSAWRAYRSGVWHKQSPKDDVDPAYFNYDFGAIREHLFQSLADDWVWSAHFESLGIDRFHVVYEEYVANRETTLRTLAHFLGVPPANAGLVDQTAAMRDEWSREMIERTWADLNAPRQPIWTAYPVTRRLGQPT